jgi:hypothetical protein
MPAKAMLTSKRPASAGAQSSSLRSEDVPEVAVVAQGTQQLRSSRPKMSCNVNDFPHVEKEFDNKEKAYWELGIGQRVRSHKACVHTTKTNFSTLFCKLWQKGCAWEAALVYKRNGKVELRTRANANKEHNMEIIDLVGSVGCQSLEQKQYLCAKFKSSATVTARAAKRTLELDLEVSEEMKCVDKKKVQKLKETLFSSDGHARQGLGEIAEAAAPHKKVPHKNLLHEPFFAVHTLKRVSKDRSNSGTQVSYVNLVATTRNLMARFVSSPVAQLDGGFKYNVMGWPLTLLGSANGDMEFAPTGILLSSGTKLPQIEDGLTGYAEAVHKVTGTFPKKRYVMSDAAEEYRVPSRRAFSTPQEACQNLMCWFHMKAAMTDYIRKHCKIDAKEELITAVQKDCDIMHYSATIPEFKSKVKAITCHWLAEGYAAATEWTDGSGEERNLVTNFESEWMTKAPEWHCAEQEHSTQTLPTTNNGCESEVRWSRKDAGNVPSSAKNCVRFILNQAQFYSRREWDAKATRKPSRAMWGRALDFRTLFNTDKIVELPGNLYCCRARDNDARDLGECDRAKLSMQDALRMQRIYVLLQTGGDVSYDQLQQYSDYHFFHLADQSRHCTCYSFLPFRQCKHVMAVGIRSGQMEVPPELDRTPLAKIAAGRRRKAGDCYSTGSPKKKTKTKPRKDLRASLAKLRLKRPCRRRLRGKQAPPADDRALSSTVLAPRAIAKAPPAAPLVANPCVKVTVFSHLGVDHLFDLELPADSTIANCFGCIAQRLGNTEDTVCIMDVTSVPWQWTMCDNDQLGMDRVVHVRSVLKGG